MFGWHLSWLAVRSHSGVRRSQPGREVRPSQVRERRDAAPLSAPLLEAPSLGGLERARAQPDSRDRGGDRGSEKEVRGRAAGRLSDPGAPPSRASEKAEEIAGAAVSCLERGGTPGALGGLSPVRRRLPAGRGQAPSGRSQRRLSVWKLPAGVTLRRRMTLYGSFETTEGGLSVLSWREVRRGVSIQADQRSAKPSRPCNLGYFRLDWRRESALPRLEEPCRGLLGTQLTSRS